MAFKEWAIIVDALGRGEQSLILRKGGISEGKGGFKIEQEAFLLLPTLYHQQREMVIPSGQERYDAIAMDFPPATVVRIDFFAEVIAWRLVPSLEMAYRLRGQHIWRDEVITERFDWGRSQGIYAMALRVYQLPERVEIPAAEEYGGCKSWITLAEDIAVNHARPVLSDTDFQAKLEQFCRALELRDSEARAQAGRERID